MVCFPFLTRAAEAGLAVAVVGGELRIRGLRRAQTVAVDLLAHRFAVQRELELVLLEQLDERAAIFEHDGGLARAEADRRAAEWLTETISSSDNMPRCQAEAAVRRLLRNRGVHDPWDDWRSRNTCGSVASCG